LNFLARIKRRTLNADAVIRKAEAKLEKVKAEKLTEVKVG
jgi:hypothetical protein